MPPGWLREKLKKPMESCSWAARRHPGGVVAAKESFPL